MDAGDPGALGSVNAKIEPAPMSDASPADDPPPQPPLRPDPDDCCRSGCVPCVFDLYADELARYEAALRAWRQRRDRTPAGSADPGPDDGSPKGEA